MKATAFASGAVTSSAVLNDTSEARAVHSSGENLNISPVSSELNSQQSSSSNKTLQSFQPQITKSLRPYPSLISVYSTPEGYTQRPTAATACLPCEIHASGLRRGEINELGDVSHISSITDGDDRAR